MKAYRYRDGVLVECEYRGPVDYEAQTSGLTMSRAVVLGHCYRSGDGTEAVLYLPDGQAPTPDDERLLWATVSGLKPTVHIANHVGAPCEWGGPFRTETANMDLVTCPVCCDRLAEYRRWREAMSGAPLPLP